MHRALRYLTRTPTLVLALVATPIVAATVYFVLLGCAAKKADTAKPTALREATAHAAACAMLTSTLQSRCATTAPLDCAQVTACGANADSWDGADLRDCMAAVRTAADCFSAQRTVCAIACTEVRR